MTDLTSRPAATSVIEECLRRHSTTPPRGSAARLFGVRPLAAETQSWFVGAIGELRVGELLENLGPEWTVLHAVPTGNAETDIDHVVIGPGGVFSINTKHHAGKSIWVSPEVLMVGGQKKGHLRNSRSEAKRASKALGVEVTPIIALIGVEKLTVKEHPGDVEVMRASNLVRWLNKRPVVFSAAQIADVSALASHARTWHTTHTGVFDPNQVARFQDLQQEVSTARTRRVLWSLVAIAAIGVVGFFALQALPSLLRSII